jgi:SpoVK/Ycf46/Vps4 family AAA+-type ATPase
MGYTYSKEKGYDSLTTLLKRYSLVNWVVTARENEFIDEVYQHLTMLAKEKSTQELKELHIYDTVAGFEHILTLKDEQKLVGNGGMQQVTPEKAFRKFLTECDKFNTMIFRDAENLRDKNFWRLIINSIPLLRSTGKLVLFLSPFETYPLEYQRMIHLHHHKLPSLEERRIAVKDSSERISKSIGVKVDFNPENLEKIAVATAGLTFYEIERAMIRSIGILKNPKSKSEVVPDLDTIILHKEEIMEKTAKIKFLHEKTQFEDLGGLGRLKNYIINRFQKKDLPKSGVILVGPPGTGKTSFAMALGNHLNRPSMYLNFSSIFNKLVGDSEKSMKMALDILDTVGESILVVDEVEKILGGVASSNKTDGGTTNRVFELFLKWLNNKNRDVYVIATSNNIDELPPEFIRAGRWDNIFWIDYPSEKERKDIFRKKCQIFGVTGVDKILAKNEVNLEYMTGAEIEQLVIEYKYCGNWEEALELVPKIFNTQKEKIEKIRSLLGSKYINASLDEEEISAPTASVSSRSIDEEGELNLNGNSNS